MKKNDIDKEIRMVVTYRSVSEDKFWRAFETGLSPHLTHVRSLRVCHTMLMELVNVLGSS